MDRTSEQDDGKGDWVHRRWTLVGTLSSIGWILPLAAFVGVLVAVPGRSGRAGGATLRDGSPTVGPACDQRSDFLPRTAPRVRELVGRHRGVVGLVVLDPVSRACFAIRPNDAFPAADLVAIPVMVDAFSRVVEGSTDVEAPLTMLEVDKVRGRGILHVMTAPKEVSVWDAIYLMVTVSDPTAVNLLLDKLRPRRVTERLASLGYPGTRVLGQVDADPLDSFDPPAVRRFGAAVTTPLETARLMARIHAGELVNEEWSETMAGILTEEFFRDGIVAAIPPTVEVAHKSASSPGVRHDCGIVRAATRPFVLCAMTRDNADDRRGAANEAVQLVSQVTALVYEELEGDGASDSGVAGRRTLRRTGLALVALLLLGVGLALLRRRREGG